MKLTDREFEQLSDYIKKNYGIFLKEDKKALIETRLTDMLVKKSISSFSQLYTLLQQDTSGKLKKEVAIRITTNYTYFMREEDTFSFFAHNVLPWIERVCKDKSLRVWSAGCSTGEEPYNLAMIIADYFMTGKPIIYCHKTDMFNELSRKMSEGFYWAKNWEEVEKILNNLKTGKDELKEKRLQILRDLNVNNQNAGKMIADILKYNNSTTKKM